jgi:hypothetical protein
MFFFSLKPVVNNQSIEDELVCDKLDDSNTSTNKNKMFIITYEMKIFRSILAKREENVFDWNQTYNTYK